MSLSERRQRTVRLSRQPLTGLRQLRGRGGFSGSEAIRITFGVAPFALTFVERLDLIRSGRRLPGGRHLRMLHT